MATLYRNSSGVSHQGFSEKGDTVEGEVVTSEAKEDDAGDETDGHPDGGFLAWTQVAGVSPSRKLDLLVLLFQKGS